MVRKYKKIPGTRNYKNYTDESLEEALQKVVEGILSINAAALEYHIPFGTLYNKYKGLHGSTVGGQTVFSYGEEIAILKSAATCADWGFPLTTLDLRMFAKSYLDKQGKVIARFPNNLPGIEWAISLLKRHKSGFGQRVATNIKRARAEVDHESINRYFENLQREVVGVPPSNIFNYDESNLSDDPGKKLCIYRRGVKYPEKVMNHSKSSTTVMMCGSADGVLLPPYVIYKSVHLYDTWRERGINGYPCCVEPCCSQGSRYNRTSSGWIDTPTFRDWFKTCFLPHAKRLEGRKVIIGDNLSAHLDNDVLDQCATHNISFVCLVPNSTHICQPLDVGFFRPMKGAWRKTLAEWKTTNLRASAVPKDTFPRLLRKTIEEMDATPPSKVVEGQENLLGVKRNLVSSFRATGIYPFDRNAVLKKIPNDIDSVAVESTMRDSLTSFLKQQRFGSNDVEPMRKKKRMLIEPGMSVSTPNEAGPSTVTLSEFVETRNELNASDIEEENINCDANECDPITVTEPSTVTHSEFVETGIELHNEDNTDCETDKDDDPPKGPEIGTFVLAKFASQKGKKTYQYVCMIDDVSGDKFVVLGLNSQKSSKGKKNIFRVVHGDISIIDKQDIITYLPQPKLREDFYIFPSDVNVKEM